MIRRFEGRGKRQCITVVVTDDIDRWRAVVGAQVGTDLSDDVLKLAARTDVSCSLLSACDGNLMSVVYGTESFSSSW